MEVNSPGDLRNVLETARREEWSDIAFVSQARVRLADEIASSWRAEHVIRYGGETRDFGPALSSLSLGSLPALRRILITSLFLGPNDKLLEDLSSLSNLEVLRLDLGNIEDGQAAVLARAIQSLSKLSELAIRNQDVGAQGARDLAAALQSLTNLTRLAVDLNEFGPEGALAICEGIASGACKNTLLSLDLWGVGLGEEGASAIAEPLSRLEALTELNLGHNTIGTAGARAILDGLAKSPLRHTLRELVLSPADAHGALAEIIDGAVDAQAIFAAYERLVQDERAKTLRPLNELKLLVVGNEAVGKTSLIRFLLHDQPRDPDEKKTPRVAIHEKIDTHKWAPRESPITLNVWDFGGQEIMRGTHKFFLTQGSVYLIVLEDRRQDDRSVYEWLATVRDRGAESPIIVVINKSEGADNLRLDEAGLNRDYPNIIAFMRTSCDDDDRSRQSIAKLRRLLVETIDSDVRLAHVREPRPPAWLRVKAAIVDMAKARQIVLEDEFRRICEAAEDPTVSENERIRNPDERRRVLGMLHSLGAVVAHGLTTSAPVSFREITLLDPNWLTNAIYTILNSPLVRDQGGEFTRDDLVRLLDPGAYPCDRHDFIIDMMEHPDVGLSFTLPGVAPERHLIPEALPANSPDYTNWPDDSLRFRYEYAILPQRLIPRFIVQAHRNLTKQPTRWRTGVVLQAVGCSILVSGDLEAKKVHIAVDGPAGRRRSALNVVLDDLDEVHKLNPEVKPEAMVPLPDQPEVAVAYDYLLELEEEEEEGLDFVFKPAGGAKRKYQVRELLEGIRRDPRRFEGKLLDERVRSVDGPVADPLPAPARASREFPLWARSAVGAVAAVIAVAGILFLPGWELKLLVLAATVGAVLPLVFNLLRWHRITAGALVAGAGAVQFAFRATGGVTGQQGGLSGTAEVSGPSDAVSIAMLLAGVLIFGIGEYFERHKA